MYYARDVATGRDVYAVGAPSYRRYTCPVCSSPVILRDGNYRAAHFAHSVNAARHECALYHPSSVISQPWTLLATITSKVEKIQPLEMALSLETVSTREGKRQGWGLNLTVPKAPNHRGEIVVECGGGDRRRIPMSKLALSAQSYVAEPETTSFYASWVSRDVDHEYGRRVKERIPGLRSEDFNVFSVSRTRLKPLASFLSWGTEYYFVWRGNATTSPIPPELSVAALAPRGSWRCELVSLPNREESYLEEWLRRTTGLGIEVSSRRWGVIYPPPLGMTASGDVILPDSQPLILCFEGGASDGSTVQLSNGFDNLAFGLRNRDAQYVVVDADGPLHNRPRLLTWGGESLQGVAWDASPPRKVRGVTFEIADVQTGEKEEFALHRLGALLALERVSQGKARLALLDIPHGVRVMFRRRPKLHFAWVDEFLAEERPIAWLNSFIADTPSDIQIDAGPFGCWTLIAQTAPAELSDLTLTSSERKRLEWLCWANGLLSIGGKPLQAVSNEALLVRAKTMSFRPSLLAHKHALHEVFAR